MSLLLAASPSAQQPIITHFEPSQLRISVPAQTLTVHGDNLQTVQTCIGVLATANGPRVLRPTVVQVTQTSLQLIMPTVVAGELLLTLHPCTPATQCTPITGGIIHVLPPPPTVTGVSAGTVSNDADAALTLQGTNLDTVTSVYLEGDNGTIRCLGVTPTTSTSLGFVVPTGCIPGNYTVRALTDDSAAFYPTTTTPVTLSITEPSSAPIRVTNASAIFALNTGPTTIALTGPGLDTISGLQVALDNPNDALPPVAASNITAAGADTVTLTIPASLPGKLYDFVMSAPGRGSGPSDVKFVVIDPLLIVDHLGDQSALEIDHQTIAFTVSTATENWSAIVENGTLRFFYDFVAGRPVLADSGSTRADLGLTYDSGPPDLVGGNATLTTIAANSSIGGVDFPYATTSGSSFTASWGIEPSTPRALTCRCSYTGVTAVRGVKLPAVGVLPGFRHLAAAQGGLAIDANLLAGIEKTWLGNGRGFSLSGMRGYDSTLCFLEAPLGGGLLVDATALHDTWDHYVHHWPTTAPTWTELAIEVQTGTGGLTTGTVGPIRYVPTTDGWDTAVEPFEAAVTNPHQPADFGTLSHVTQMLSVNRAVTVDATEVRAPFDAVQDARVFGWADWRALYAHDPMIEGFDLIPQWTPNAQAFGVNGVIQDLHNLDFKVLPYLPTPGLGPNFLPLSPFDPHIIQF
ncbi:MAG: hypothetical protein KDE27_01045 [Planctomycetes bacterium]|nr:hypothetical protein [Planctomycetota bacterium]